MTSGLFKGLPLIEMGFNLKAEQYHNTNAIKEIATSERTPAS
jgi:hypothetical protein